MATKSNSSHSRFVYANYKEIQSAIEAKKIDANDIIFCKDTHEMIVVRPDLSLFNTHSKIYLFDSEADATEKLNVATDTYAGQLVAIKDTNGKYRAYIVNKEDDKYVVTLLSSGNDFDYNAAVNRPIVNVNGLVSAPVIAASLNDGVYRVTGSYQIAESYKTVFSASSGHILMIETVDGVKHIKQLAATNIIDYQVSSTGEVSSTTYLTEDWLADKGYATTDYVDNKITALDAITKAEAEEYIQTAVDKALAEDLENQVNTVIDSRMQNASDDEITNMFK